MSLALVKTALKNHNGPLDVSTGKLQALFEKLEGFIGGLLNRVAEKVTGYLACDYPVTEDGYTWFKGYNFSTANGRVVILIPYTQDWDKKDGSQSDRAVAIYTSGAVKTEEVEALLTRFCEELEIELLERAGS